MISRGSLVIELSAKQVRVELSQEDNIMIKTVSAAIALAIVVAANAPAFASGSTTGEQTCKRGMVYDTKAGKCVKK